MSETIIVAIIISVLSFAGTSVGAIAGIRAANKITVYRITCLETKMDKHNNIVERLTRVEARVDEALPELSDKLDKQTESINQRIDDKDQLSKQRTDALANQINKI